MKHPSTRRAVSYRATSRLLAAFVLMSVQALKLRAAESTATLVAFGDSLTAGYQLPPAAAFPVQLEVALRAKGYKVKVVNAGVSGDTTANGLDRLEWTLAESADGVILELGANDALRGLDPAVPRANLNQLVAKIKTKGADVLLAGMRAPTNWGAEYKAAFDAIYPDLASRQNVALYPYFLEGVRLEPKLLQTDGLHPTAEGVAEIVKRILPSVEAQLKRIEARKAAPNP